MLNYYTVYMSPQLKNSSWIPLNEEEMLLNFKLIL